MAEHHLARGREAFAALKSSEGIDFVLEAARTYDEEVGDALGAMRALFEALEHDPKLEVVLPRIQEYADSLDQKSSGNKAGSGALVELRAIAQVLNLHGLEGEAAIPLLERRAQLREERLDDASGALTEWARVIAIAPEHGAAGEAFERLADKYDLWAKYLWLPAWRREQSEDGEVEARHLRELADLYENRLQRRGHALRARMAQWRLSPQLPEQGASLDSGNDELWRLASKIGSYKDPVLPKDPLRRPELTNPELDDAPRWARAEIDPESLKHFDQLGAPNALDFPMTAELADIGAVLEGEDGAPMELPVENTQELDEIEEVDDRAGSESMDSIHDADDGDAEELDIEELDIEELDIEELEMDELDDGSDTLELDDHDAYSVVTAPPTGPQARGPAPPKRPFDPSLGLPKIPQLQSDVVPSRPALPSAWAELERMYLDHASTDPRLELEANLGAARMWDEGADEAEPAFVAHERALSIIPEDPRAIESLTDLATRREASARLIQTYAELLNDAALPEHVIALGMRIAGLHETAESWDEAERRYRGVLAVQLENCEALEKLESIYAAQDRHSDYADAFSKRLSIQAAELDPDAHVERSLQLAQVYESRLDAREKAIDVMRLLAREYPERSDVWERLVRLLLDNQAWAQAIEAMKTCIESTDAPAMHAEFYASMARVYETELELPDRAIEAWRSLADAAPQDGRSLEALARLYEADQRWEELLPVLDARLDSLPNDASSAQARSVALVAKARALREGMGDEAGALQTLEELAEAVPQDDAVSLQLARHYVDADRGDEAVQLLRGRLSALGTQDDAASSREALSIALATHLLDSSDDPEAAREVVDSALKALPDNAGLLRKRVDLSRRTHDLRALVGALAALPEAAGHLEAADIARTQLKDNQLASRIYSRVLTDAKAGGDDPHAVRRQFRAIEGMVQIRTSEEDTEGAIAFMDKQLAEVEEPSVCEIGRASCRERV